MARSGMASIPDYSPQAEDRRNGSMGGEGMTDETSENLRATEALFLETTGPWEDQVDTPWRSAIERLKL
jgi:hypothetical protein